MANTGGGVVLLGIGDSGQRIGLSASLISVLDPARITDQLRRKAPSASVTTSYVEFTYYRKRYGVFTVQPLLTPLVFDVEWGYNDEAGRQQLVVRPGVLYVRTPGRSGPARQADLHDLWERTVDAGMRRRLARIEQVAALPADANLIVVPGGQSGEGLFLTSALDGRPVRIVDDPSAPAVRIDEVQSSDMPYSSVAGELRSQVRHWQQADHMHRVSKQALMRWWLQRDELDLDEPAATFCVLSAAERHGYPMYWASQVPRQSLRELLENELTEAAAVPCMAYPYIVGTFFWDDRAELLESHLDHMSAGPQHIISNVLACSSYEEFLCQVRWGTRLRLDNGELLRTSDLLNDASRAQDLFQRLLQRELDGEATENERGFAKQLDLLVHSDYW